MTFLFPGLCPLCCLGHACIHYFTIVVFADYMKDSIIQFLAITPLLCFGVISPTICFMFFFGCLIIASNSACLNLKLSFFSLNPNIKCLWVKLLIHIVSQQELWLLLSRLYTSIFNLIANITLFPVSPSLQLHTILLNLLTRLPTILKRLRPIWDSLIMLLYTLNLVFFMHPSLSLYTSWYISITAFYCILLLRMWSFHHWFPVPAI